MYVRPENLWIVSLAEELADKLAIYIRAWSYTDRKVIGNQLQSAAYSVAANIIEGQGRSHALDKLRFFYFARGSLGETKYWVRRANAVGLLDEVDVVYLKGEYERLSLSLNAFIAAHKRRNHLP